MSIPAFEPRRGSIVGAELGEMHAPGSVAEDEVADPEKQSPGIGVGRLEQQRDLQQWRVDGHADMICDLNDRSNVACTTSDDTKWQHSYGVTSNTARR